MEGLDKGRNKVMVSYRELALLQNRPLFQAICPACLWVRHNRWLFVPGPTASRASGGTGAFCPGWRHQPGQKALCPGWCLQPGQNSLAPLSPSLSPRPSHSAHLFLMFLARERGVLAHFFTTFVKRSLILPSIHRR